MKIAPNKQKVKKWLRSRYHMNLQSIVVTVGIVVIWGLSYYFMNVFANIASSRSVSNKEQKILPDWGFEVIPRTNQLWLTDLFDALMFIPTVLLIIFSKRPIFLMNRALLTSLACNLMRMTTMTATSCIDPRENCQIVTTNIFTTFALHRCGDCMYSGHTIVFVICALVWNSYAPKNIFGYLARIFFWLLSVAGGLIIISNRAHYTSDILLAYYVCIGAWYTIGYAIRLFIVEYELFPNLVAPRNNYYKRTSNVEENLLYPYHHRNNSIQTLETIQNNPA